MSCSAVLCPISLAPPQGHQAFFSLALFQKQQNIDHNLVSTSVIPSLVSSIGTEKGTRIDNWMGLIKLGRGDEVVTEAVGESAMI
ncbi:hypothetical protein FCM35_KLT00455 [Carex littledalei]|uniref:Uncharacterized protein n=1 Tax=Carex littledalei TaxID=544730 RepID=A0A833RKA4_9POAL|nr:hypothetical protein FCM35_KLT17825 [Carex littledalei]KAF3341817.1 hypothetical protein FCM35_KLT00455 [Carex littledalei]